jgi:hypothetical protein
MELENSKGCCRSLIQTSSMGLTIHHSHLRPMPNAYGRERSHGGWYEASDFDY